MKVEITVGQFVDFENTMKIMSNMLLCLTQTLHERRA